MTKKTKVDLKNKKVNPDDLSIMKKKTKSPIPLITATIAVIAGAGAFYFINSQKDLKIETKTEVVQEVIQEQIINDKIENVDFGYKGNLELGFQVPKHDFEGNIKLNNFQVLSMDKLLRTVISFDKFNLNLKEGNKVEDFIIKNFDITTNEENTYINIEGDQVKDFFKYIIGYENEEMIDLIFDTEGYIKLDEAKPIIDLLGSNDELVNNFIKGLVSSNPSHYLEKYGIDKKIKKKFFSKNSYKLLFQELETIEDKTYIGIKNGACKLAIQTIEKMKLPHVLSLEDCNTQLVMINDNLGKVLYITQDGEKESINYDDGGNQFTLSYKNGEILLFHFESPFGPTVNYENSLLTIKYDIGEMGKQIGITAKLDIKINFDELTYKVNGLFEFRENKIEITGSGNKEQGKIKYMLTEKGVILSRGQYQYQGGNYGLSIKGPMIEITGKLLNNEGKKQWQIEGKWNIEDNQDSKLGDVIDIERALLTWLSDYDANPEGILPIEGLTPISYKGEIIAYQGLFTPYFEGALKNVGFDGLQRAPISPDEKDYIVSISADRKKYSVATVMNEKGTLTSHMRGTFYGDLELENGETIEVKSLIYKGDYVDGEYKITKRDLENEEDLDGFIGDYDTQNIPYSFQKEKNIGFDNKIISKGLLEYNGSGEINTAIIQLKANYITRAWETIKSSSNINISLKDSNLQLSVKHNIGGEEKLNIIGKGKWGVNNTDVKITIKGGGITIPIQLTHKDNIGKSTIDMEHINIFLSSEISSHNPFSSVIGGIINFYSVNMFTDILEKDILNSIPNTSSVSIDSGTGFDEDLNLTGSDEVMNLTGSIENPIIDEINNKINITLNLNSKKEGNNTKIDGGYNISKGEEKIVSISLKGNISTEGFSYSIPTNVKEINWLDYGLNSYLNKNNIIENSYEDYENIDGNPYENSYTEVNNEKDSSEK